MTNDHAAARQATTPASPRAASPSAAQQHAGGIAAGGISPTGERYPDRCYRSPGAMAAGVLLLALAAWLGIDGVIIGSGQTRWTILATLLTLAPLVVAFTLRPAVFAGEERMRVRNPFRTIHVPWTAVEALRASYSVELFAGGKKYTMWSIPVSIRARRMANRHNERLSAGDEKVAGSAPKRASSDSAVDELRELAERHGGDAAGGAVTVRTAWEILAPFALGVVALVLVNVLG